MGFYCVHSDVLNTVIKSNFKYYIQLSFKCRETSAKNVVEIFPSLDRIKVVWI